MSYDKDLLRSVGMGIPCMHMQVLPMAIKALKEFKAYIDGAIESGKTLEEISLELESYTSDRK